MQRRGRVAALTMLLALTGCGGADSPSGTPPGGSPAGSAAPSTSGASAGAGSGSSPGAGSGATVPPGDVKALLRVALRPLLTGAVIDFRHEIYSGQALAVVTKGRAFQHVGWQSTTTSPKQLDSSEVPQGGDVKGTMQVRAVGDDVFLQLSTWQPPLAGCWLRTGGGQVPGGQLAMTPGVPGYVTLLGALQPEVVVDTSGDKAVIAADVPLRVGLQLLTTGALGLLQLDASQLDGATVPVGVRLTRGVVTDVELLGTDLVSAVRAAGGQVAADAEATLGQLRVAVGYRPGPAGAPQVTAPAAGLVMSNADVKADRGC